MTMTNKDGFDESVESFLNALGLPAYHPFVERTIENGIDDIYHEGKGHKEWSVFDYFTPHGHAPLAERKSVGRQDTPASFKMLSFFGKCECPVPLSSTSASFSSDGEKACEGKRYDWIYGCLPSTRGALSSATHILNDLMETFHQVWPSLRASFQLTLRLFAPLVLIVAVLYLIVYQSYRNKTANTHYFTIVSCTSLSMMVLMLTDECCIQEYGRIPLASAFCGVIALVVHCSPTARASIVLVAPFVALAIILSLYCHIYIPKFQPGFYYNQENPVVSAIVSRWPVDKRTYDDGRGTPWLVTGDSRTGIPFFLNFLPKQRFVRR